MKKLFAALAFLAFMSLPVSAVPLKVGEPVIGGWYLCKDVADLNKVMDTVEKDGVEASYIAWDALVSAGNCRQAFETPAFIVKIVRQTPLQDPEGTILSLLEVKIGQETYWALTGDTVINGSDS